jgi:hypothetical protein
MLDKTKTFSENNLAEHKSSELSRLRKRGNFLVRQEISNLTIECNFKVAITCNVALFFIFLALGIPIYNSAQNSVEYSYDYTNW